MKEIVEKENVENLIYEVRRKQVMIDSDLATLYECTNGTKDINKAVGRNLERFPEDFYFQLTTEEYNFKGQIYDAYSKVIDIFNESKGQLVIIDAYADKKILDIIKDLKNDVIIITKKNNLLSKESIESYNEQYSNLKVIYDNTFHDRYFIIDNQKVYHCGTSINRIGHKTFCINSIDDKEVIEPLINRIKK